MTTAVQAKTAPVVREEHNSVPPSRAQVITAIREATGISEQPAQDFLSWIQSIIAKARKKGYTAYYLTDRELNRFHDTLNAIAPDRTVAQPDSAHSLMERFALDPSLGEMGLVHDWVDVHRRRYCTVTLRMSVVR